MTDVIPAALVGMLITGGLFVIFAGYKGALPEFEKSKGAPAVDKLALRIVLAAVSFFVVLLITGWPVAAIYCGLAGAAFPTLAQAKKQRVAAVERVEALATWVESLRDIMAASAGMQEAIRVSAKVAPAPIRQEVNDLSLRLQHESVTTALRQFAADMAHPVSDIVVASLVLAAERQAGGLHGVLTSVAKSARDSASMWRRIEGGRSRTYAQNRMVGWTTALFITFMVLVRREFLEPFDSFGGQIALAVIGGIFFGAGLATYRLGKPVLPVRVFSQIEREVSSRPIEFRAEAQS